MTDLEVKKTLYLRGTVTAPPSKSLTHRALITSSLSKGTSQIQNVLICDDTLATINACSMLGVHINEIEKNTLKGFYDQFMNIFKSYGVEPIEVKINDPFNYSNHEALTTIENEDVPENTILEIVLVTYSFSFNSRIKL